MNKIDQLKKTKELLEQANILASKSMPNNRDVQEARLHIRKAINNIEMASEHRESKKRSSAGQFEQWWGNIQSGAAISAMSPQAQTKSLSVLNKMIGEEQQKLDDLENKFHTNTFDKNDSEDGILID